jgi:DNA-binding NtrC family response regulator
MKKLKIVAVDDDKYLLEVYQAFLGQYGEVTCFSSSLEAAHRLLSGDLTADLLVTDFCMPLMSGARLAALARSFPDMKIVMVSGYDVSPSDIPGVTFFRKPIDYSNFFNYLDKLTKTEPAEEREYV